MKKKPEAEKENSERWLLTYADMITLLMLFFIVMYAMSQLDKAKFDALSVSLNSAFTTPIEAASGLGVGEGKIVAPKDVRKPYIPLQSKAARKRVYDKAFNMLQVYRESSQLKLRQDERGLVVQLGAEMFFGPASARLNPGTTGVLETLAQLLAGLPNDVQVEGYTDNTPLGPDSPFSSNYELAFQRSYSVLTSLADYGAPPSRMSAVAYGETRPMTGNATPEERAYNRRVDVLILWQGDELPKDTAATGSAEAGATASDTASEGAVSP